MRYALTYTTDVNDAWGTTDTIIFEIARTADEAIATRDDFENIVYNVLKDNCVEGAEIIATSGWYYIRNCDDVDTYLNERGENES